MNIIVNETVETRVVELTETELLDRFGVTGYTLVNAEYDPDPGGEARVRFTITKR